MVREARIDLHDGIVKVIVAGASGFVGRHVLLRAPKDWSIVALYHRSDVTSFVDQHALANVTPFHCDLTDADQVTSLAAKFGGEADAVLYLAANSDPTVSVSQPRWDLEENAGALVNFLSSVRARHLVFVSSGAVYDGLVGPVSPASPLNPNLPYAISKLASESYVRFFAERRKSVGSYVNVRFFGAYGPYEPLRKITTKLLKAFDAGAKEFTVRGDGQNLVDFMYADDAADALLDLIVRPPSATTIDVAAHSPMTIDDIVRRAARALGKEIEIRHEGITEEPIRFHSIDHQLHTPRISFEDGMIEFARIFHSMSSGVETA